MPGVWKTPITSVKDAVVPSLILKRVTLRHQAVVEVKISRLVAKVSRDPNQNTEDGARAIILQCPTSVFHTFTFIRVFANGHNCDKYKQTHPLAI